MFGLGTKKSGENTNLAKKSFHNLEKGAAFMFSKLYQQDLSEKYCEIRDINTYDFKDKKGASFALMAGSKPLRMKLKQLEDEKYFVLSKQLKQNEIAQLFDTDDLAEVMTGQQGTKLKRLNGKLSPNLESWSAAEYSLIAPVQQGYFYEEDYRGKEISIHDQGLRSLDHYCLQSEDKRMGVDVEIYNQEQTKIYLTLYLPVQGLIAEYYDFEENKVSA